MNIGIGTWIGFGAQIVAGVNIGKNCVIGAGAIVTKDIPDYCVVDCRCTILRLLLIVAIIILSLSLLYHPCTTR